MTQDFKTEPEQPPVSAGLNWAGLHRPETAPITVNVTDQAMLLADLETRFAQASGFSVATINLDHVVKIAQEPDFHRAYAAHSHVTADGRPIVWLQRLAGQPVTLVAGSDLVAPVAGLAARAGVGVALLGSTEDALAAAAESLQAAHPGLNICAQIAPPMGFDPEGPGAEACIETLRESGARLCYLALGAPKQERFAAFAQEALPHMGFLSIGAGLDFLAGRQQRAPRIMRVLALEWLWRLLGDPRRMAARYGACFAILPRAMGAALKARHAGSPP